MKALPALLFSGLALTGCTTLGPDFEAPASSPVGNWQQTPKQDVYSSTTAQPLDPRWWTVFGDPQLSRLQERLIAQNLDLQSAGARLAQSRALSRVIGSQALPQVDVSGSAQRQRNTKSGRFDYSGNNGERDFNHSIITLNTSWELDLWGRISRRIEEADALLEADAENRRDVLVLVLAETAQQYIRLRGEQAAEALIRKNLEIARRNLELTRIRLANGVATELEVAQAEAQLSTIEARLPVTLKEQARLINALSLLLGDMPGALRAELQPVRPIPLPPRAVPIGLPSELARRRPDIREAEARLHAATAGIGSAKAEFYPRITLNGSMGFESSQFMPFKWDRHLFSIGPSLYIPIFEGGRLKGQLALREAQQQDAAIAYRHTVLGAWHEVDDALTAYAAHQQRQRKLVEATGQSERVLDNARRQYLAGAVDFLNVLDAQRDLLNVEEQRVRSDQAVAFGIVDLYKALGGGWEGQPEEQASR